MGRWGAFEQDGGRCGNLERITEPSLVLHIFSFLGLPELFTLRAVCKSWYDAVLAPRFVQLYKPSLKPWAVLRVRTDPPVDRELRYDEEHFDYGMELENHTELWRTHLSLNQRKRCSLPLGPSGSRFVGLCSSNGLVCGMLMEHRDSVTLAVGNPITNMWKALPAAPIASPDRPRPAYLNISMEAEINADSSSYQVVILYQKYQTPVEGPTEDDDDDQICSLQYESESCSWHEGPLFSTSNSLGSPLRGCAFFYTGENIFPAYDPHSRAWSHVAISPPARNEQEQEQEDDSWANWSFGYIGAFMYKGKCYWASFMFNAETFEDIGVAIWEMKQENSTWVLVSRILSTDLFGPNCCLSVGDKDMTVRLVEDTAFISVFYRKESHGVWPPVAYDFALSKWYTCCMENMENEDIECNYVVIPSLTAKP
ncbi:uncharacterized protein LOC9641606 [Selaginella moellendorffii]|nr:uncharacterized protein LOC9641606 [Selaginella moellendorffii]|eukprot:XP_002971219.2 uncharacterized protein LOC9641606 [Selaginella moellendorffii]